MRTPKSIELDQQCLDRAKEDIRDIVVPDVRLMTQLAPGHKHLDKEHLRLPLYTPALEIEVKDKNTACFYTFLLCTKTECNSSNSFGEVRTGLEYRFTNTMDPRVCYWDDKDKALDFAKYLKEHMECLKKHTHILRLQEYILELAMGETTYL